MMNNQHDLFHIVSLIDYTDYCTCFYVEKDNEVVFYDEIKDCPFTSFKVNDGQEAILVMQAWKTNAPSHVICDIV